MFICLNRNICLKFMDIKFTGKHSVKKVFALYGQTVGFNTNSYFG